MEDMHAPPSESAPASIPANIEAVIGKEWQSPTRGQPNEFGRVWLFGHSFGDARSKVRAALARCACAADISSRSPSRSGNRGTKPYCRPGAKGAPFGNTNANARVVFEGKQEQRHVPAYSHSDGRLGARRKGGCTRIVAGKLRRRQGDGADRGNPIQRL